MTLEDTFKDTKIEFEDLDGLSWPRKPTPPPTRAPSPPLEPLFGLGKPVIYETDWTTPTPSSPCCQCGSQRSACQVHPRRLTRSRRSSAISLPRVGTSDPFAFVSMPSGREQELDWQMEDYDPAEESVAHPPSLKRSRSRARPFGLVDLPPVEGLSLSLGPLLGLGPPPGLPPPLAGFEPPQGVPFPTGI